MFEELENIKENDLTIIIEGSGGKITFESNGCDENGIWDKDRWVDFTFKIKNNDQVLTLKLTKGGLFEKLSGKSIKYF